VIEQENTPPIWSGGRADQVLPRSRETSKRPPEPPPCGVSTNQTLEPKAERKTFWPFVSTGRKFLVVVQSFSATGDEAKS
jgi:hypothetical protein